jgi:hypothetical protein
MARLPIARLKLTVNFWWERSSGIACFRCRPQPAVLLETATNISVSYSVILKLVIC